MKFKKTLFLLEIIFIFIFLSEFILRKYIGLGTPPLYESYEGMEYKLKANQNLKRFGNRIIINNASMRNSFDINENNKEGKKRILIFGDSVLWGGSQTDQEKIATSILRNKTDNIYEIYNISAASWGPGNWIEYIKENGFFNAKKVILLISSHDLVDIPYQEKAMPNITRPTTNPSFSIIEMMNRYILPKAKNLLINNVINLNDKNKINIDYDKEKGSKILNELINLIQKNGIELTVIQFWNKKEFENNQPNNYHFEIKEILSKKNVKTLQSLSYFKDCSKNSSELFVDNDHPFTLKGQECLANALRDAIYF